MPSRGGRKLLGRRLECETLDRLVSAVRAGQSEVLVLSGEAGVGKTALLRYLAEHASGCRVMWAVGAEAEMELAFAGLHQLCAPMLRHLDRIPGPQRDALASAFGMTGAVAPDRFLVGLAVLSLMSDVAEQQPLVCLIDDVQWLDEASAHTLMFVARRLQVESVALVLAMRPRGDGRWTALPRLPITGLSEADARALLDGALQGPMDAEVRDAIVAGARGNPLALLELPRVTPAEMAGGFRFAEALPTPDRLEESFRQRLATLPRDTQRLLLVAAAEPSGEPALLWRAARHLDVGYDALAPAADADLFEVRARARFRHPLVRSAIYRNATPDDRRSAHAALASATDPASDPDRRAWHRAEATAGPNEEVAAELARSAGRAQARGGLAAAAAFLERAAELTLDRSLRATRLIAAAQAKHEAGAPQVALALLNVAESEPLDDLQRARLDLRRAQVAFTALERPVAPALLLAAAAQLESLDPTLARDTYLDAFASAMFVGRLSDGTGLNEVAMAARAALRPSPDPPDVLLEGLVLAVTEGFDRGAPQLIRAVDAYRTQNLSGVNATRQLWLAIRSARDLWDEESWDVLSARHIALTRQIGALSALPIALSARMWLHLFRGELTDAAALIEQNEALNLATAFDIPHPFGTLGLAALEGRERDVSELTQATIEMFVPRGEGMLLSAAHHAQAVLYNGLGRYGEAVAAAEQGAALLVERGYAHWSLPELVEAAARSGQPAVAAGALERLSWTTGVSGTEWALGIEARSRALVSEPNGAEDLYREAIARLGNTRLALELARAHLLYGEWLRRAGRRTDARNQLRRAHQMLTDMGVEGFAERARRELVATGETARKRTVDARYELTIQEAQIARLASDGRTNPEIGAEMFLSPRTIEWHLSKVFSKLGVTSRRQLRATLPSAGRVPAKA
jgi:DNA-binding CsgD family transcriptional regulator